MHAMTDDFMMTTKNRYNLVSVLVSPWPVSLTDVPICTFPGSEGWKGPLKNKEKKGGLNRGVEFECPLISVAPCQGSMFHSIYLL